MMYWIISAWFMGFIGSTHCIGMCGPLVLAVPSKSDTVMSKVWSGLLYNLGRVSTYVMFGATIGISQKFLIPLVMQSQVSIIMGIILILISLSYFLFKNKRVVFSTQNKFYQKVGIALAKLYNNPNNLNIFSIGLLNGLLPCGLVYAALATAFASMSFYKSIIFMAFFGFGTLPVMWGVVFFANYITPAIRSKMKMLFPVVYAIAGVLLILRGSSEHDLLHQVIGNTIYCSK
jgi:sulfite exporter TauE/SafE